MISAIHLLWIIPVSVAYGVILAALVAAGRSNDNEDFH